MSLGEGNCRLVTRGELGALGLEQGGMGEALQCACVSCEWSAQTGPKIGADQSATEIWGLSFSSGSWETRPTKALR